MDIMIMVMVEEVDEEVESGVIVVVCSLLFSFSLIIVTLVDHFVSISRDMMIGATLDPCNHETFIFLSLKV